MKCFTLFLISVFTISCHRKSADVRIQSSEILKEAPPLISLQELSATTRGSIYLLEIYDENDKVSASGSGFAVSEKGFLITNRHVIENAHRVMAKNGDGTVSEVLGIAAYARDIDAVILKLDRGYISYIKFSTDESPPVVAGDSVAVIGSPLGLEGSLSSGIVAAVRPDNDQSEDPMAGFIQITAPISPGSSGSPVFNMRGEIIGMATNGFRGGQNINFAIPANKLAKLFSESEHTLDNLISFNSLSEVRLTEAAMELWMTEEYQLYDALRKGGDGLKALLVAKELVDKFPQNNVAHFYLALAYSRLNLNAEAIKSYKSAIKINPKDLVSRLNLGIRLGMEGQHEEAIQTLRHALEIDPELRGAWCSLGISLLETSEIDSAVNAFRREIALNPSEGLAWLYLSSALYRQGEVDKEKIVESRKALEQAVSLGEPEAIRISEQIKRFEESGKQR